VTCTQCAQRRQREQQIAERAWKDDDDALVN
jgi:hypothetical protein